jgi:light-regulated signal transduction histidine kinase (bacteriophytochrome)
MLTAKADDELRARLLRSGVQDYLVKPCSREELRARVENLVAARLARRRLAQQNERLERLAAELKAVNQELEAFSFSVSHDLRAPLRRIDGFAQAFIEDFGAKIDPLGLAYLRKVRREIRSMNDLIEGLLTLARATRQPLSRSRVDVTALARRVAERLARSAPERQVSVHVADGLAVEGDLTLLGSLMENLLGNAWKFTSRRERASIAVGSAGTRDGRTVFYVRDDGAGFDPAYAKRLFGAFQRLHAADEFPGVGVGLATVQRIVHRHGGAVWAEGAVGQGATFYFTL